LTERGPRLFLSVGDTSGDHHAARLVQRLEGLVPGLDVEGHGGPALAAAGCRVHTDLVSQSIFGFRGAIAALPEMFGVLRATAGLFDRRRPDLVVLVDYPGFNLYVARLAHRRGIPVVYFVAPQLWAWAPWRARRFARVVDEALVIFPFEEGFFRGYGLPAHYVGHPLLDGLPHDEDGIAGLRDPAISARPLPVALLPGSRGREVRRLMPRFLDTAARLLERHPDASFHTAHVSPTQRVHMAEHARAAGVPLQIHGDAVHAVMASCRAALVASGTATLETGLLGTPLVLAYHITRSEQVLVSLLLVPPDVGQVNLVAGRRICPEVILPDEDVSLLVAAMEPLLTDGPERRDQLEALAGLRRRMTGPGAVERAAQRIAERLGAPAA
jgi:lipid-A-disaccharide synthase